mmetsp:Transcript_40293/g.92652  ORF Transcript_40293/g.92652 Transcript_40293/m.92652 type:complete len:237 (-) Transcript_40293:80-790(-)
MCRDLPRQTFLWNCTAELQLGVCTKLLGHSVVLDCQLSSRTYTEPLRSCFLGVNCHQHSDRESPCLARAIPGLCYDIAALPGYWQRPCLDLRRLYKSQSIDTIQKWLRKLQVFPSLCCQIVCSHILFALVKAHCGSTFPLQTWRRLGSCGSHSRVYLPTAVILLPRLFTTVIMHPMFPSTCVIPGTLPRLFLAISPTAARRFVLVPAFAAIPACTRPLIRVPGSHLRSVLAPRVCT